MHQRPRTWQSKCNVMLFVYNWHNLSIFWCNLGKSKQCCLCMRVIFGKDSVLGVIWHQKRYMSVDPIVGNRCTHSAVPTLLAWHVNSSSLSNRITITSTSFGLVESRLILLYENMTSSQNCLHHSNFCLFSCILFPVYYVQFAAISYIYNQSLSSPLRLLLRLQLASIIH